MLLKEILKNYYPTSDNPILKTVQQHILSTKLKNDMELWAQTSPAIDVLNQVCLKLLNSFDPDSVIEICKQLKSDDWDILYPALQGFSQINFKNLFDLIIPSLELLPTNLENISINNLKDILIAHCAFEDNMDWNWTDDTYQLLPESEFNYFQSRKLAYRYRYLAEKRDCDDFKRIDRGWLSILGYGNLTVGGVEYNAYNKDNECIFAHAVEIVVTKDEDGKYRVRLSESQKNHSWPADGTPSGEFWQNIIDHIKIRKLTF